MLNAARRGSLRARVGVVISDRPKAQALERAKRAGVPAYYLDPKGYPSRAHYERALIACCRSHGVRLVCLAGFMRILSPIFVRAYPRRIVNIHPALLPAFPGAHAVRDALAWGTKVTGVTVHLVDEEVDHGPIVLQEAVTIAARETANSLLEKVHKVEHRLYPRAIQLLLGGRVRVAGRTVRIT